MGDALSRKGEPLRARLVPKRESYGPEEGTLIPPGFLGKNRKTIKINLNPEMEGGIEPGSKKQ